MRIKEPAKLEQFSNVDKMRHPKTDHQNWQESVLIHWYDNAAGIGGLQRIGHEPNRDGGQTVLWSTIFTIDGVRYRCCDVGVPTIKSDRFEQGFGAGSSHRFFFDSLPRWQVREQNISLDLEFHNFFRS